MCLFVCLYIFCSFLCVCLSLCACKRMCMCLFVIVMSVMTWRASVRIIAQRYSPLQFYSISLESSTYHFHFFTHMVPLLQRGILQGMSTIYKRNRGKFILLFQSCLSLVFFFKLSTRENLFPITFYSLFCLPLPLEPPPVPSTPAIIVGVPRGFPSLPSQYGGFLGHRQRHLWDNY